jgi:F-type H+-transporting ATPase subunit b
MNLTATLIAQGLAFAALTWIIATKIWPPLLAAIEARQQKIAEGLAAAERSQKDLVQAQQKVEEALREARGQANEIIAKAEARAAQIIEQAKSDAIVEGGRQIALAQAEIDATLFRAREDLRKQVGAIAVAGAGKLIGKEINATTHAALIDELAEQI